MAGFVPYCGSAPVPGALHWNLDPILIAGLVVLAVAHRRFRTLAWFGELGHGRLCVRLANPLALVCLPALQFERGLVFGSGQPTHGDRTARGAANRARIGFRPAGATAVDRLGVDGRGRLRRNLLDLA